MIELRDYQSETVERLAAPPENVTRSLVVLPTGTGKTTTFASYLDRILKRGEQALVLAHRDELLTQAAAEINAVAPQLTVEVEKAASHAADSIPQPSFFDKKCKRTVVVASVQTLHEKRLKEWGSYTFSTIICDEAHHASARAYVNIFKHFGCYDDVDATRLVGFTATPNRTDGVGLGSVFQEIAVEYTLPDMIKRGRLVPIRAWQVDTSVDLSNVKVVKGDYDEAELQDAVNNEKRNLEIIAAYEKYASGMPAIAFCAGVEHSHEIARLFNERGIPAASVWGAMKKDTRDAALAAYQRGEIKVLCNNNILIEGYNAPATQCILLCRPTTSSLLVSQMIGRGTRLHPGKEYMLAIDIADVTSGKSLCSVASLFGLPEKFKTKGGNVVQMAEDLEDVDPRLHHLANDRESLERIVEKTKTGMSVVEIDLFSVVQYDETIRMFSPFSWIKAGDERYTLRPEKGFTYDIHVDTLGRYAVTWHEAKKTVIAGDKARAFRLADGLIRKKHSDKLMFVDASMPWRKKPASEKQLALIAKLTKGAAPQNLTQGDAAILLDSLFASKRGKRTTAA